jgi:uncharacterized OB-fold protein
MSTTDPYLPLELAQELFTDRFTQEFWDRCRNHELAFQKCTSCGTFRNPPVPVCHHCSSNGYEWSPVSGAGTVYSFTIVTHPVAEFLQTTVPFNVSLVEFDDAPGVRLITNVVDAEPDELAIGMKVQLHWEDLDTDITLPRCKKA